MPTIAPRHFARRYPGWRLDACTDLSAAWICKKIGKMYLGVEFYPHCQDGKYVAYVLRGDQIRSDVLVACDSIDEAVETAEGLAEALTAKYDKRLNPAS